MQTNTFYHIRNLSLMLMGVLMLVICCKIGHILVGFSIMIVLFAIAFNSKKEQINVNKEYNKKEVKEEDTLSNFIL